MNDSAMVTGMLTAYYVVILAIAVVCIVAMWKVFQKAGKPGWAAIIPFYNTYCLADMAMGNGWWFLLTLVPCVNIVFSIVLYVKLAQAFGKGGGFAVGLILLNPIFMMILGFGSAEYVPIEMRG